jgi:predicted nucleic acid-binding protein
VIKLDDTLRGVQRLGLDTAPFIYFLERNPAYIDLVREVVRRISSGSLSGHTSVITLAEVLVQPLRQGDTRLAQHYRRFLSRSRNLTLEPITADVAKQAAELRARYGLRTPDALQIAAALSGGCSAFLTNDGQHKRVTELQVLVLDELEL